MNYVDLFACDMWSFGITVYQLIMLELPFKGDNSFEYKKNLLDSSQINFDIPEEFPDDIKFIVKGLLD